MRVYYTHLGGIWGVVTLEVTITTLKGSEDTGDHSYNEVIVKIGVHKIRASQADRYIEIIAIPEIVTSRVDCRDRQTFARTEDISCVPFYSDGWCMYTRYILYCTCHKLIECQEDYFMSRKVEERRRRKSFIGKPVHIHSSLASASCSTT